MDEFFDKKKYLEFIGDGLVYSEKFTKECEYRKN